MNDIFVYRGIAVMFSEEIGWFCWIEGNRFNFEEKETCKNFIDKYHY